MKLNNLIVLTLLLAAFLLLSACMSKYYDRFGGFPIRSETLIIRPEEPNIKLLVTYRYPYQAEKADTTSLNLDVRIIVNKKDLSYLSIDRLVLSNVDSTYLYAYPYPAVYDTYAKYPLSYEIIDPKTGNKVRSSEKPSIFTITQDSPVYDLILYYRIQNKDGSYYSFEQAVIINTSEIKRRTGYFEL